MNMQWHDFIFSDQPGHRRARHIAFWLVWWLAFTILFWFPTYTFKGWGPVNPNNKNLLELGLPLFIIRTLIFYSLSSIIPQIALTYVLIYWLLPKYYFKRINPFLVGGITISVLLIFYFVAAGFKYFSVISNHIFGSNNPAQLDWSFKLNLKPAVLQQISSLPIVLGFALMIKLVKR